MKIYSFQRLFVWQCLQELGIYHPFHIENYDEWFKEEQEEKHDWGFLHAYAWLNGEMKKRHLHYHLSDSHLCWGWAQWWGKKKMPDKRYKSVNRFFSDDPFVMLELDIPENRLLLSDYDAWHFVLNHFFLGNEAEIDTFHDENTTRPYSPETKNIIKASWQQIFNFPLVCEKLEYPAEHQAIQATFYDILYTDVQKVHFFDNGRCIDVKTIEH